MFFYRDLFTPSVRGCCINVAISVTLIISTDAVASFFMFFYRDLFTLSVSERCVIVVISITPNTGTLNTDVVASVFCSSIETYLHRL
jgi:predicted permease